jgi:hypothetical protein
MKNEKLGKMVDDLHDELNKARDVRDDLLARVNKYQILAIEIRRLLLVS